MDDFYIVATTPSAGDHTRVLKHGDTFGVFDRFGDIQSSGLGEQGIYHEGTRYLSKFTLTLGRHRPFLLNSTVQEDNFLLTVNLTNPDFYREGSLVLPRGTLHIARSRFLWKGTCFERLNVSNFGSEKVILLIQLHFEADFADIFEVRGMERKRRGTMLASKVEPDSAVISYKGLDDVIRSTRLDAFPRPQQFAETELRWQAPLEPKQDATFDIRISCETAGAEASRLNFEQAAERSAHYLRSVKFEDCEIVSSNEQFNKWLARSGADLYMMISETSKGAYPYAGVPWFNTVFGRDGIITALEYLWVNPSVARGVLSYLASTQAGQELDEMDAQPGKILHETRKGEMAALQEIPFGRYYGSVDATPLFVFLAGAYYERTGDISFAASIWPKVEAALGWLDRFGDADGDGFVEYQRKTPKGLINQGWKDSSDSVFHADGRLAEGPIALCEVQAYVYAAKLGAASLCEALGDAKKELVLREEAARLRERFDAVFWCEDLGGYALALDGRKELCRVRTSNAGHCLWTGIAASERAGLLIETLMSPQFFSGWGIRTVSASERRYNPMSYHNGSVWPHDNALITAGMARYGLNESTLRVLEALLEATRFTDLQRLPELFCGFTRRAGEGPTLYPVACSPQAWASASVFLLLQSCLGLSIDCPGKRLTFSRPALPRALREVKLSNLRIGESTLDLTVHRYDDGNVGINVTRRTGDIRVVVIK